MRTMRCMLPRPLQAALLACAGLAAGPLRAGEGPAISGSQGLDVTGTCRVQVTYTEQPEYPVTSRRYGEQGVVRLRWLVLPSGQVQRIEVLSASFPRLAASAESAVRSTTFRPHACNGTGVWVERSYEFELKPPPEGAAASAPVTQPPAAGPGR